MWFIKGQINNKYVSVIDFSVVNRTRRRHGYNFEYWVVNKFKSCKGWDARRLGGSSTGLPDIVATNNDEGKLLAIEAKSGINDVLYVPQDQLKRCADVLGMFGYYPDRHIILAFKFLQNKRVVVKKHKSYEKRKLLTYYVDVGESTPNQPISVYPMVKCTYKGEISILQSTTTIPPISSGVVVNFKDCMYKMPWE